MRHTFGYGLAVGTLVAAAATASAQTISPGTTPGTWVGPSSSQSPYVEPTAAGWEVVSLLSVGDAAKENGYRMVGIPDGLGAARGRFVQGRYVADKAYLTVFMNHELRPGTGIVRDHGQDGAFVSQWTVHLNSLQVKWGEDLIQRVFVWDPAAASYVATSGAGAQFNRFCSGDLPATAAFQNVVTGKGYDGRIYVNGEESGDEGRAFAHVVSGPERGRSYQLPSLGRFSWENSVAHPNAGGTTIVVGLDDSTPGQVYVYVGDKRSTGNPVERAGLSGGKLFGVKVTNGGTNYAGQPVALENAGAIDGTFVLEDVSAFADGTGASLQTESTRLGITQFARPEDGAWDTKTPNVFYFVTTGATIGGAGQSARLYKLTLNSLTMPSGGSIALVVDSAWLTGTDGQLARSFDNITVGADGRIVVQEDPGGNVYIAKTWLVDPANPRGATQVFESDRDRFLGATPPFTVDEESSGVIEITDLVKTAQWYEPGRRYYLADMQSHHPVGGELVEGGQLYMLISPRR